MSQTRNTLKNKIQVSGSPDLANQINSANESILSIFIG